MGSSSRYIIFRIHPNDPDVIRLAGLTGLSAYDVMGRAAVWFRWIDEHCSSHRTGVTLEGIDQIVGSPDIAESRTTFSRAMLQVGWITEANDETVHICGFEKNFSKSAKRRALDAKRKSAGRRTQSGQKADTRPPVRGPTGVGQDRKEESPPNPPKGERTRDSPADWAVVSQLLPETHRTDAVRDAWLEWTNYRKQLRKYLTHASVQRQAKLLGGMSPETAVKAIEESVTNGWTGLFDPIENRTKGGSHATQPGTTLQNFASQRSYSSRGAQQRAERRSREFADDLGEVPIYRPPD